MLAHGDEDGLRSPLADAVCLAAAPLLAERGVALLGAVFGAGCDGELTPAEVIERIGEVAQAGGYLGAWGPGSPELLRLDAAVAQVPTEASAMALRCAHGELGSATIRDGRRTVELTVGGRPRVLLRPARRAGERRALRPARGRGRFARGGQRHPAGRRDGDRARLGVGAIAPGGATR